MSDDALAVINGETMGETRQPRRDLHESYIFWVTLASAIFILGGIAVGVGVPTASSGKTSLWHSGWFISGFIIVVAGVIGLLWALVLYLARSVASGTEDQATGPSREYDTPEIPSLPAARVAANPPLDTEEVWMRSTLREIRPELQESLALLTKAQQTGHYWNSTHGLLPDYAWNSRRQKLSGFPNIGFLYDELDQAFSHIKRINALYIDITRIHDGNLVRSEDDLAVAVTAIHGAIRAVGQQLYDLG